VVSEPLSAETVVREFMATFSEAWPMSDAMALGRFFSENAEYCNGPLEPVRGRDAIIGNLASMMAIGGEVDADIIHVVTEGPIVMIERVDYVKLGEKTAGLRVAGVFEVHDGVITAWRDYFDSTEFGSQLSKN
jgi:limonene-1,2-epoxide hydrolase